MSENFFKDDYPTDLGLDISSLMSHLKMKNGNSLEFSLGDSFISQPPKSENTNSFRDT